MRRLFVLIVLVAIAGAADYSRYRPADVLDAREVLGSVSRAPHATGSATAVKAVPPLDPQRDGDPIAHELRMNPALPQAAEARRTLSATFLAQVSGTAPAAPGVPQPATGHDASENVPNEPPLATL